MHCEQNITRLDIKSELLIESKMEIEQAQNFYAMRQGGIPQPLDCSPPDVLDLCIRKRCRTPSPEGAFHNLQGKPLYADPPTSMLCFSSPGSHTGSETSETSMCSDPFSAYPVSQDVPVIQKAKIPRPFKAYPKDPLSLAMGVATAEAILGKDNTDAYSSFRQKMLSQVQNQNLGINIKMRRTTNPTSSQSGDPTYWEKRRKNNEAAKRSRDARRAKEDEIAIRCAFLEQENLKLRYEVSALRNENDRLRTSVYN